MAGRSRKWMAAMLFAMGLLVFTGGNLQAARIEMTTRLGFGDCVIPGRWVPLRVQITGAVESARVEVIRDNDGGNEPSCESFTLSNTGVAASNLEIPVLADIKCNLLTTRLYHREQLVTEQSLDLSNKIFPGHLILTINLPATELQAIQKSLLPLEMVKTVPIRPEELPSFGLNYDGISGLVINEPGLIVAPAQIKALRSWLTGGGRVVIFAADRQSVSWIQRLTGGSGSSRPNQGREIFPVGFGSLTIIHQEQESAGVLRFSGGWREILSLKPYSQNFRLSSYKCFPGTFTAKSAQKFSLINPLSVFLFFWTGAGVFVSLIRKKKPIVSYFLILTLFSVAVAIPLGGKLASDWKHGATWHTRGVILPDGGGMLVNTIVSLKSSNKFADGVYASPWGVAIRGPLSEAGGLKLKNHGGRKTFIWRHQEMASRYSLRFGSSDTIDFVGCFPELGADVSGISTNTLDSLNLKLHQLMIPNETISWDGKQWRLLINNNLNVPLWQEISNPPQWFQNDAEWMQDFQSSFPDTLWLGGRYLLPNGLCLKIQGGSIPELFWVMPAPRNWAAPPNWGEGPEL